MLVPNRVRRIIMLGMAGLVVVGCLMPAVFSWPSAETGQAGEAKAKEPQKAVGETPQKRAESLGIKFEKLPFTYLNGCNKSGKLLFSSGFASKTKGRLGTNLTTEEGYLAARECAVDILRAVWNTHGTLDNLRVVKVFGCVNSKPEFVDQPKVINGCSDMLHDIFGAKTDGYHARSALGFVSLPGNAAVEIEAIFEIKD